MVRKLQKHGNSQALVIEKPLMEALGIDENTPLNVTVSGHSLIVTRHFRQLLDSSQPRSGGPGISPVSPEPQRLPIPPRP